MFLSKEQITLHILPCFLIFSVKSLKIYDKNADCTKALNFWGQNLDKVPKFDFNPCVKKLDLIGNEITDIEEGAFDNLPNLMELNLLGNRIPGDKMFSFGSLPKLKILDVSHQLPKSKSDVLIKTFYPKLETLDLSNVVTTKILISNWTKLMPKLRTLKLGFNKDIDIEDLMKNFPPSVRILKLNNNEISFINLTNFNNLENVNLNWNKFSSLYITQNPADCRGHDQLCIGFMESLTELSVSFCYIQEFDVQHYSLDPLPSLQKLDLSLNKLKTLGDLKTVRRFVPKLPSLKSLNLRMNRLESIESLCPFQNLEILDLSVNSDRLVLTEDDEECLLNLREFYFSGNGVKNIPEEFFGRLNNLEKLDLSSNRLNKFPKITLTTLRHLNLNSNVIESADDLDIEHLRELQILNLAKNRMSEGEVEKLRKKLSANVVIKL